MRAFRFPLESLRVLRKQKERAAQQRYARSLFACHAAAAQLEKAAKALEAGRDLLARELGSGVSAAKIMNLRTWCIALEIHQHERKAAFNESRRIADIAFQEMSAARRDREGLDRFYDKARQSHARDILQEEQKMFDELAVQLNGATSLLQPEFSKLSTEI
jgi:flagellar export protein FliJ